jgi:hypothetical protein
MKADENRQAEKGHTDMEHRSGLSVGTVTDKFSGNLKPTEKAELQDIAFLLGIQNYGNLLVEPLRHMLTNMMLLFSSSFYYVCNFKLESAQNSRTP